MPTVADIRAQFPMYADVPDGDLVRGLHGKFYSDMPYAEFLKNIDFRESVNPTDGMSGTQKFLAGAGKAFTDIGRGARQIVGAAPQGEIDEARTLDQPLMHTGAGIAGNITGNAAMFAPTMAIPGANTYTGAGLLGAAAGALQPVATGESRALNTGLGGAAGVAGQAMGNALGRVLKPVSSSLGPEEQALAQAAQREGIPLTAGQATGSRPLQIAESVMENLPLTSRSQLSGREAQQRAFTAAALRKAGISADAATPEVLGTQMKSLGGTMEGIAKANALDFNQGLADRLASIAGEAGKRGKSAAEPINAVLDNILSEVGQGGKMSGEQYQAWRQMLRPLSNGGGAEAHYFGQIRKALDESFNAQMEAGGSEAWKGANRQYANLKTVMQAAGGPGNAAAVDQIAPSQLATALRSSIGKEGVALGRGDLNELSNVGTRFVRDQVPNSGSAQRLMVQSLLTGGGGAGVGAVAGAASGHSPLEGAAYGAGIGASSLIAPKLAQALMNSGAGQSYLRNGLVSLSPAERAALVGALRTGAIAATPALMGTQ